MTPEEPLNDDEMTTGPGGDVPTGSGGDADGTDGDATDTTDGFDPGLFYVFAVAANGVDAAKVEKALLAEIDNVVKNGVTPEELAKVRNIKLVNLYRLQETINGKAQQLGNYETFFGDWRKLFEAPAEYEKLTPADIKAVAARYLKKSQRTIGVLAAASGSAPW